MADLTVFERKEIKYYLNETQYARIMERIAPYMQVDKYGKHTICNEYGDTDRFDIIAHSVDKPRFKQKIRIRSYGVPAPDGKVFLEVKKKYHRVVYKRRVALPLPEAEKALVTGIVPIENDYNAREIEGFLKTHRITRRTYLAYDRVALFCPTDETVRMTFDTALRYRTENVSLAAGDHGKLFSEEPFYIWEIKGQQAFPLWLVKILSEEKLYPTSFSKYGFLYTNHLLNEEN